MKDVIAERGLMIKLSDLYEYMQDAMIYNLEAYLRSIILEPGLRIAEGDEFLVEQSGMTLIAKAGAVVFPDYDLFVPDPANNQLVANISGIEIEINDPPVEINLYVTLGTEETHPQYKAQYRGLFYTVQRNTLNLLVVESTSSAVPTNSYLIATGTINSDHVVSLTDLRYNKVLKLLSHYTAQAWDPSQSIMPSVTDVTASIVRLADYKQTAYENNSINRHSIPVNRRGGYCINVQWPAPDIKEIESLGGIAYYKVRATPTINDVLCPEYAHEQLVLADRREIASIEPSYLGCMIPADLGVTYTIQVYRISNMLDLKTGTASTAVVKTVGPYTGTALLDTESRVVIDYAYSSDRLLAINCDHVAGPDAALRIYAKEYSGATPDIEDVYQPRYLLYEGPVKEVLYMIEDDSNDGVAFYIQTIGKHQQASGQLIDFELEVQFASWEDLVVVEVPESSGAWPDKDPPNGQLVGVTIEYDAGSSTVILTVPLLNQPHNRLAGEIVHVSNSGLNGGGGAFENGWQEIIRVDADHLYFAESNPGVSAINTCDIDGNAYFYEGDPVMVSYPATAHFANHFVRGQTLFVANSTIPAVLPDGTYFVKDVDNDATNLWAYAPPYGADPVCVRGIAVDHNGIIAWAGVDGYGDICAHDRLLLENFELRNSAIISRIVVTNRDNTIISNETDVAAYLIVGDGVGADYTLNIPSTGYAEAIYNEDSASVLSAGASILVSLERPPSMIPGAPPGGYFNASGLKIFIYFRYRLR